MSFIPGAVNHTLFGRISSELRDFYERNMREVQHLEEGAEYNPFSHLDKSTVLQECKVFHDANFVKLHPKRCCHQIVKLLYFYIQGETFSSHESLDVCMLDFNIEHNTYFPVYLLFLNFGKSPYESCFSFSNIIPIINNWKFFSIVGVLWSDQVVPIS